MPSLLIFGPHVGLPSTSTLNTLRDQLLSSPQLSTLRETVLRLSELWDTILDLDPDLRCVDGRQSFDSLKYWIERGGQFPFQEQNVPNHVALPITILIQIGQYYKYITEDGRDFHEKVLDNIKTGGAQGFCVGLLSAITVALSCSSDDLASNAATALQLSACIGAYVDRDMVGSFPETEYSTIALRSKDIDADAGHKLRMFVESFSGVSPHCRSGQTCSHKF